MTHFLAMQRKLAKDVEDDQLHHSQHGQYEDVRLPHRTGQDKGGDEEET